MIYFEAGIHIYYNTDGWVYDSPSKVFSGYKNKFDAKAVSQNYARKHGQTPEYWQKEWDKERDKSLDRGTGIHQTKEDLMFGRGIDKFNGRVFDVYNSDLLQIKDLYSLPDGVYPEIPLWNHNYRISGKPDKLVIETIKVDGPISRWAHLDDYKTNKAIHKTSYQDKRTGQYKMMLGPLSHLMDSNWIHYGLQMSFYQFMLAQAGFKVGERTLIHIPHPVEVTDLLSGQVTGYHQPDDVIYKMPYMEKDILVTLADYNKKRKYQRYNPQTGQVKAA